MKKNLLANIFKLYPLWIIFVAGFYFWTNRSFFESFNPKVGFVHIILYFNLIVVSGFIFTIVTPYLIKLSKIKKLNLLHFLAFLFLTTIFVNVLSLSRGYSIYNGAPLIKTVDGVKFYENEIISYEDIILKNGKILSDEKKAELNLPVEIAGSFEKLSFSKALYRIGIHMSVEYLKLFFILFSMLGAGLLTFKLFSREINLKNTIFAFGLGTIIFSEILFLLAKFSYLNLTSVSVISGIFFIAALSQSKNLWKVINENSMEEKLFGPPLLILIYGLAVFLSWNFSEAMEPLPIGFDDVSLYMNLPNLIAHFGSLININSFYSFSLIQGAAEILNPAGSLKKVLIFAFGTLSVFPVYFLLKEFVSKKYAVFGVAALLLTPTIFAHNFLQIKVEMSLLFFGTSSILCTYLWMKEKNLKWLALAGLFLGFAFTIKLTAFFLVVAIISAVICKLFSNYLGIWSFSLLLTIFIFTQNFSGERLSWLENDFFRIIFFSLLFITGVAVMIHSIKDKIFSLKKLHAIVILGVFLLLPLIPWVISNVLINKELSISSAMFNNKADFNVEDLSQYVCVNEGITATDYERYMPEHSGQLMDFLYLPWDLTMSTSSKSVITNIGFLFLAICPAFFFTFEKKHVAAFALCGIFFWIFWAISAKGIIWYGFTGFAFLILLFTKSFAALCESNKVSKYSATIAVLGFFIISFFFRSNMYISRTHSFVPYYAGLATYENYVDNLYPEHRKMADILNSDPIAKIYLTDNAFLFYFINENNLRVYRDHYLDTFDCLDSSGKAVDELKKNFDYIVISAPVNDLDFGQGLHGRTVKLFDLANQNFTFITGNKNTYLFRVN